MTEQKIKRGFGWVFRIEVVSNKTPWTKDAEKELQRLLYSSELFGNWKVDELFEPVTILNSKKKVVKP